MYFEEETFQDFDILKILNLHFEIVLGGELAVPCTCNPL